MGTSLTVKQAKFCAEYLKDGNASRAYRASYNAEKMSAQVINNKASALLKQGEIRVRVDAARQRVAAKAEITLETITGMLAEDRRFAIEQEAPSACVAATMGLAKVMGLLVDRSEHSGPGGTPIPVASNAPDYAALRVLLQRSIPSQTKAV